MSKVIMTMCDGCGREITGKLHEPDLCLLVTLNSTKMTCHYCYDCGAKIIDYINKITAERFKKTKSEVEDEHG